MNPQVFIKSYDRLAKPTTYGSGSGYDHPFRIILGGLPMLFGLLFWLGYPAMRSVSDERVHLQGW